MIKGGTEMYSRMLDKKTKPTVGEMAEFSGENSGLFLRFNEWLSTAFQTEQSIVFPYGNKYGWGIAHRKKKTLICNVFPEENAFTVMMRLSNPQWESVYNSAGEYMRDHIDNRYPCNGGGWIHYRVTGEDQLGDLMAALSLRCG